jgi:hypothetical protein
MNTSRQLAKPVLAIIAAGLVLSLCLVWIGLRHRHQIPDQPSSQSQAATEPRAEAALPVREVPTAPTVAGDGGLPPVVPIPLKPMLIDAENGSWLRDKDYLLAPHRAQEFGGVEFLMDGMIQLQGHGSRDVRDRKYRLLVAIPLSETNRVGQDLVVVDHGSNVASVHLLGGTRYDEKLNNTFAHVIWHYADGTSQSTPLQYAVHLRDWTRNPYELPAHLSYLFTKVVWIDPSQPGRTLRLYRLTLPNPAPEKILRRLELSSAMAEATLFVVGVTLDPLKPGQRPDNTPDLEPTDPVPASQLQVFVQDSGGQPVAGAELRVLLQQHSGKDTFNARQLLGTDAAGSARIGYPPQDLDRFEISASAEGYGSRKMAWDLKSGDSVPSSYTLKFGGGISIGGVVVDPEDRPVAGASISLNRFWTGGDDPRRRGEEVDFPTQKQTTDPQGHWEAKGLPPELLDRIGLQVTHPDFPGTNFTVGATSASEKEFRAGTFKIVLHRGLEVRGRVLDDAGNAIADATVWAGRKYFRDRQQTKSDSRGGFAFRNVNEGDTLFSVMAAGRKPEGKTFNVRSGMEEIVFRLAAGSVIRARVQNESGDPLGGTRVGLSGNPGQAAYDSLEFTTTTDSDGKFEWTSAPDEPTPFYFFHEGYESKRDFSLKPNEDNVVTLQRNRQLQGQVVDATNEQPVGKFSVRTGHKSAGVGNESEVYGVVNRHEFTAPDGRFTLDLGEEQDNAVAVSADGYADTVQSFPAAQDGIVQIVVRLKPSAALDGVVLKADGTPAAGVNVSIVKEGVGSSIQLSGGRLRSYGPSKLATTDSEGRFHIGSSPDDGQVVAVGDAGFARVPLSQVRSSGIITLSQWGRVEGTLTIQGKPGTGQEVLFTLQNSGIGTDFNGYKATVDEQGHFAIENVPPGEGAIVRLIKTAANSWTYSHNTPITVEPGKTTQITLGDTGAVLQGTVRFETPPADGQSLTISGTLSSPGPTLPHFNTPEETRAYLQSPEWKQQVTQRRNFAVAVNADGSLQLDSIPAGTYTLNITAMKAGDRPWTQPPVATGQTTITVPDNPNPLTPISIGEIVLKPAPVRR